MSDIEVDVKPLEVLRLASRTITVSTQAEVGQEVGPLFGQVADAIVRAGGTPGTGVGLYQSTPEGMVVTVGFIYDGPAADGFDIVDVAACPQAATTLHKGTMEHISDSWMNLMQWAEGNGYTLEGTCREIYVHSPDSDQTDWITELQQPVSGAASGT